MANLNVLIVEDDPYSWDVLSKLLQHSGMTCTVAETGEDAVQQLENQAFGLVIADLALPRMDGWDLLKLIRSRPELDTTKVVAITAFYDPSVAKEALRAGFLACYPKPPTLKLVGELQELLQA